MSNPAKQKFAIEIARKNSEKKSEMYERKRLVNASKQKSNTRYNPLLAKYNMKTVQKRLETAQKQKNPKCENPSTIKALCEQ